MKLALSPSAQWIAIDQKVGAKHVHWRVLDGGNALALDVADPPTVPFVILIIFLVGLTIGFGWAVDLPFGMSASVVGFWVIGAAAYLMWIRTVPRRARGVLRIAVTDGRRQLIRESGLKGVIWLSVIELPKQPVVLLRAYVYRYRGPTQSALARTDLYRVQVIILDEAELLTGYDVPADIQKAMTGYDDPNVAICDEPDGPPLPPGAEELARHGSHRIAKELASGLAQGLSCRLLTIGSPTHD